MIMATHRDAQLVQFLGLACIAAVTLPATLAFNVRPVVEGYSPNYTAYHNLARCTAEAGSVPGVGNCQYVNEHRRYLSAEGMFRLTARFCE